MRPTKTLRSGFTLIELLLVVTIIGVLMAMLVSGMDLSISHSKIALAQAELGQMEAAIQEYKQKLGFYPPDNPANPAMAPLYFELLGTTNDGVTYVTLDASGKISTGDILSDFDRTGFANSSTRAHSTDEFAAPLAFLNQLRPKQVGQASASTPQIKILVCSVAWPANGGAGPIPGTLLNPWRYVSSHPTNNTDAYDLWVDVVIRGKVHRVSNWNKQPEIVP